MKKKLHHSFKGLKFGFLISSFLLVNNSRGQILWSTAVGSAWLTGINWTGGAVPTTAQVAQFGVNPTSAATGVGINMNNPTNNGTNNQAVGAIEITSARSNNFFIGNSSTTANGVLTLNGASVNGVVNVIIRNNAASSGNFTIQDVQGVGNKTMALALNNTSDNKIVIDASGNIIISNIIQGSANKPLTIQGTGSGRVDITGTSNTFSGLISVLGSEVRFSADGSFGAVPGSVTSNAILIDGGRLATVNSGVYTLHAFRGIQVGNSANTSISTPGSGILTYTGVISDKPATVGSWAKQGGGTLVLGGLSTYSGVTAINNGILQLSTGSNRLPTSTTISIGQSASTNLGTFDLNGQNQQIAGLISTSGTNATASNNSVTSTGSAVLTLGDANNYSFGDGSNANSGVIGGAVSIIKTGSGIQTFGDINSYTGSTQINAGELRFSPNANENLSSSAVTLNGGTLGTSGIAATSTLGFSTLNLANNSIISLETTNTHTLSFAASNGVSWTASKTLTITGWQGTYATTAGTIGTVGRIFVGNSASGLTAGQLAQIVFFNGTDHYPATLLSTGELVPKAAYYWNGGSIASNPANGGTGSWQTANAWRMPTATGSQATWADGFEAYFAGTAGVVTAAADVNCTSVNFTTNNYTLVPSSSQVITGSINIGAGQTLTYDGVTTGNKTITFHGNVPTGSITLNATATGGSVTRLSMGNNSTTSFTCASPIKVTGSGFANIATGGNGNTTVLYSGNITGNNTRLTLGSTQGYTTTFSGVVSNTGDVRIAAGSSGGAGTIVFSGANTWTGNTLLNNGSSATLKISGNDRLPTATTFSFGETSGNGNGNFDLNGNNQTLAGLSNGAQFGGTILNSVASSTSNLTINASSSFTTSANLTNGSGTLKLTKSGSGIQTLSGTAHTLSGGIVINAGGIGFSPAANVNINSCPVTLNSGTLSSVGIAAAATVSFSTINLSNNSAVNLETVNSHTLSFAVSSGVTWTASGTLTIIGWQGTYTTAAGSSGTVGKIFVGTTSSGLTNAQLNQIRFFDGTDYYGATLLSSGELVPRCTVSITAVSSNTPCENAALNLSVTASGLPTSLTYSWSGPNSFSSAVQNPTISSIPFSGAGVYSVTVSNCPFTTSTLNVTVIQTPSVVSVASFSVCGNKNVAAIVFTTNPSGQSTLWFNTNPAIGISGPGTTSISAFTSSNVTSSQTGNIQVTPSTGACTGTPMSFFITVNGPQASTIWTGAVSSSFTDPDNWTNCGCGAATDATIAAVTSPSFNPIISATANVKSLTIDPSASLSVSSNQTLNVNGDFTNNGSFTAQAGNVNFVNSSVAQTINGSSTTTFYDLSINNSNGVVLASPANVRGTLWLNNGTLSTSNNLTLMADGIASGRIGPISSGADITGNVTVQQYAQGGTTGWALLGAPITSGLTFNDWNDNFAITCPACTYSTIGGSPFTSIYSYSESAAGNYSATAKYAAINSITDPISFGAGYWVWLGDGYPGTSGIMFDVQGTVAKSNCSSCSGTVTIPLSYNNQGSPSDDGWNLISNPLPSPISWTALRNGNTNVDNAIYAYNADLGTIVSYVNGVISNPSGGINDTIPMCQGVYVHAIGSANLFAGENVKVYSNTALLKASSANALKPIVRLTMNSAAGAGDQTTLYFENGATTNFDAMYDAYEVVTDATQPALSTKSGSLTTDICGLPDFNYTNISVPILAITPTTDTYTFSLNPQNFPSSICLELIDNYTGISTNILANTYTCTLFDTTSVARFVLNFKTVPMPGTTNISQPTCSQPGSGSIVASGSAGAPWNYVWKNSANVIVKTTLNTLAADSLVSLTGGSYFVSVNSVGTCNTFTQTFNVNQVVLPISQFSASADTVYLTSGAMVSFNNSSSNATNYYWNFGDGNTSSIINPINTYSNVGVYNVILQSTSSTFCSDSSSHQIVVLSAPVGIQSLSLNNLIVLQNKNYNDYSLNFKLSESDNVTLTLTDVNGKVVLTKTQKNISESEIPVSLKDVDAGVYLLMVKLENRQERKVFKLIKY